MRESVSFPSHGVKCAAWFYQPENQRPLATIVVAHGLAGTREMRLDAYAERFAQAGFACLVFDYRYFGDSEGEPRQLLDIKQQQQDWQAAIAYVRSLPTTDPERIVLWGTSLSGAHVISIAASEPAIAAVIAQVPHLSGMAASEINSPGTALSLMAHGLYDKVRALLGLVPHYIMAITQDGKPGIISAPGEVGGYLKLAPAGREFDMRISARVVIDATLYSPVRNLRDLRMPVLMQVGTNDLTTPEKPALDECPKYQNIDLRQYAMGHFEPYIEPGFSRIIEDQLSFLRKCFSQ
jgi:hypothetical protein